jgi:hypothetical protein
MTKQTVAEYVADYEFRGETDYSPTLDERAMIEDAINGFICEQEQARTPAPEGEVVGTVSAMPGTSGFTMAVFRANDVPVGTPLYASPVVPVGREEIANLAESIITRRVNQQRLDGYTIATGAEIADAILAALGTKATDTGREA